MKRANAKDMELGNMMFGNSRGKYQIPRGKWQDAFVQFLEANGFDGYGNKEGSPDQVFENDTFIMRPYYWGDDEAKAALPNFVYKPEGVEIQWYKYPMRDAYCSHNLTFKHFQEILEACAKSMR